MKFESIKIKNFRNFSDLTVKLNNKKFFFGLNDVGKTNFLYAIRYVLDKEIRKQGLSDCDFHNKNVDENIEIVITIDIKDETCIDCKKLIAKLKGAISSKDEKVYIKLLASYNDAEQIAFPTLYWGGDEDNLEEIKNKGIFYELDNVFSVIYVDSYVDLNTLFKKHAKVLAKNIDEDKDKSILDEISKNIDVVNDMISSLSGVKNFENQVTPEYHKYCHLTKLIKLNKLAL